MAVYMLSFLYFTFFLYTVTGFDCLSKDKKLQVHIVPHTHDDVGWVKTFDEYYHETVQYILDSAIFSLKQNANRTFIYVEIAFFKKWWNEQTAKVKESVKVLVKNRQLEFINGGWCMNDEATTHYNAIIDQMTYGLHFIEKNFGEEARPTVAWQIDPFGHSAEQASLFSLMSFDGLFFGRIDYADKEKCKKKQHMEMLWQGSRNYKSASQIFAGVLYNGYNPPPGFCYDELCADPPIQGNVKERVDKFVEVTCEQAKSYQTNHIMLTMGSDFQYKKAQTSFEKLDKLIHNVKQDGRINVFYSTPSRYLKALHDAEKEWEVKTDDFFPYAHCPHCYWTGYFTSRPSFKGYERESNSILQACKQIESLIPSNKSHPSSDVLRREMALSQHHDAVTGTEKQYVQNDYAKRLSTGRDECLSLMHNAIKVKYEKTRVNSMEFKYCDYLNISVCEVTETEKSIVVNFYNPVARPITTYLRVPVRTNKLLVLDSKKQPIKSQIVPLSHETKKLRKTHSDFAAYDLVFTASAPGLGFSTYFINKTSDNNVSHLSDNNAVRFLSKDSYTSSLEHKNNFIENEKLRLEFSGETGRLAKMIRKDRDLSLNVDQQFFWYEGCVGNIDSVQTSGAYIFRPTNSSPNDFSSFDKAQVQFVKGPLVEEVRQTFGTFVSQVIRLYKGADYAEFEHTVGPIPVNDNIGKEIITRFDTDIQSAGVFFTDANGRETKKRKRDFRETWDLKITEPVSENYYPVNSRIYIKDKRVQFSVMTDRSQGGTSMKDGQVELMLHRRLLVDDFLGVEESLNEPGVTGKGLVTRGRHRVLLTKPEDAGSSHREQGLQMMMQPIVSFSANPFTLDKWFQSFVPVYTGLSRSLPPNVHMLTLEAINETALIIRFEHFYEIGEDSELSKPVVIQLDKLFLEFEIVSLIETNLSANQLWKDKKQWNWKTREKPQSIKQNSSNADQLSVSLNPMEIKTFIAQVKYNAM